MRGIAHSVFTIAGGLLASIAGGVARAPSCDAAPTGCTDRGGEAHPEEHLPPAAALVIDFLKKNAQLNIPPAGGQASPRSEYRSPDAERLVPYFPDDDSKFCTPTTAEQPVPSERLQFLSSCLHDDCSDGSGGGSLVPSGADSATLVGSSHQAEHLEQSPFDSWEAGLPQDGQGPGRQVTQSLPRSVGASLLSDIAGAEFTTPPTTTDGQADSDDVKSSLSRETDKVFAEHFQRYQRNRQEDAKLRSQQFRDPHFTPPISKGTPTAAKAYFNPRLDPSHASPQRKLRDFTNKSLAEREAILEQQKKKRQQIASAHRLSRRDARL